MAKKLVDNEGFFKIPLDIFDFKGPNGEWEISMQLESKNFIIV